MAATDHPTPASRDTPSRFGRSVAWLILFFLCGLLTLALTSRAQTNYYWDTNGATNGAGATPPATWSSRPS